ncbi:host attachment protein [Rhodoferax lacus]|uniref:Host attachment protein n=1 Tax=Rhodoferax lacus TaxID=2184758 RepID=A0A3E1RGP2_9BURK|nr:host attachment protein [Rhodoferax lacus]RFO98546.1 host attachment protein [Rhodoferax lacus]
MPHTWILVANGQRARFLQHDRAQGGFAELADFVYPYAPTSTHSAAAHPHGEQGRGHGSAAHGGTQFEPQTPDHEKAHTRFARQLADYVNKGVEGQQCDRIALIASSPMLGALRPLLSASAQEKVLRSVDSDFTVYQGHELQQRVQEALGPGM